MVLELGFMMKTIIACLFLSIWPLLAGPSIEIPLAFERNAGQTDPEVKYLARGREGTLWLTEQGPVLGVAEKSRLAVLRLRFEGGRRSPRIEGENRTGGITNYFIGNDPAQWRTDVSQFAQVRYRDVYPGIDVVFYGNGRTLEYDFVLRPGADPSKIRLRFDGEGALRKDLNGDLVLKLGDTEVRNHKPVIRQDGQIVEGEYILTGKRGARFALGAYDRGRELVIDPVMTYGTLIGGSAGDQAAGVAIDAQGNLYMVGTTSSTNFPSKNALYPTLPWSVPGFTGAVLHAFVVKINPSASGEASVVFCTLFGGSILEQGFAIGVDASGDAVITGLTSSPDLPLKNAFNSFFCGVGNCEEGFVTKFSPTGNALLYSSYLGGSGGTVSPTSLAMDASGNAWVAGFTTDPVFTVTANAFQSSALTTQSGNYAGFVSEVSAAGSLLYSTYFSASPFVQVNAIAVDAAGNFYIGGGTNSPTLPTTPGALQSANPSTLPASDLAATGFVAKLNPNIAGSQSLLYATYLGGSSSDQVFGLAVDASGNIYAGGSANSPDFPVTATALRTTYKDTYNLVSGEGFVSKLNPSATGTAQLVYSTFYGGSGDDEVLRLAVDSAGRVVITGVTNSPDLLTTSDAFQCCYASTLGPGKVAPFGFLARLDPTKSGTASLLYSSYLGGTVDTYINSLALDSTGNNVVLGGYVEAQNTPLTQSAFQSGFAGENTSLANNVGVGDAYLASFNFATAGPAIAQYENGGGLSALPSAKIAPGLVFTLKGTFPGPTTASTAQIDSNTGRLATMIEGVQVLVNGIACPLVYVSTTQINAIAPYELASNPTGFANVQVIYNGVPGNILFEPVAPTAPGILSFDDGTGQGAILNSDGTINGSQNAAAAGSIVTIFATGEGQTSPAGIDGGLANDLSALPHPVAPVSVTIGGMAATNIAYAGTAPQEVYGLFQVNVTVPSGVAPGSSVPVVLTVGGVSSQAGLTMAVK
jgi:uncharacterized protein (TIGR03437 family)